MATKATQVGPPIVSPLEVAQTPPAVTRRGQRTLDKLVTAAQVVFTRTGFLDSRMSDIAKEAGVAHGTVYTYFDCKEDVFLAVARRAVEDILERSIVVDPDASTTPEGSLRAAAESVVAAYEEHAAILGSLAIVASFDERASSLRQFLTLKLIDQADRVIKAFQRAGLADPSLNRPAVATALGAMAESFAYVSLVQQHTLSRKEIADALVHVWVRSIGLETAATRAPRKARKATI
jgi:AcrR family transcriptional regulator